MELAIMNYIQKVRNRLSLKIDVESELLDLYTLIIFLRGTSVTLEDIHDAWSIWRTNTKPDHSAIIPFDELSLEVQELDREYAVAVKDIALELFSEQKSA